MYIAMALALVEKLKTRSIKLIFVGGNFSSYYQTKWFYCHYYCFMGFVMPMNRGFLWLCVVWALHCYDWLEFSVALNSIHLNSTGSMICIQLPNAIFWLDKVTFSVYNNNNLHFIQIFCSVISISFSFCIWLNSLTFVVCRTDSGRTVNRQLKLF